MNNKHLDKFICNYDEEVHQALRKLEENTKGILIVIRDGLVIGVITDGDIRRRLLSGSYNQREKVSKVCNRNFTYALNSDPDEKIISLFSERIKFLPILDENKVLVDIQFSDLSHRKLGSITINARAPARITFGGGGSDKLDYFSNKRGICLNAAIKKYAFCSLTKSDDIKGIQIISSDYDCFWEFKDIDQLLKADDPKLLIYQKVISFMQFKDPLRIVTHCDFPVGSGLGGSSSLTIALLKAFSHMQGITISKVKLAKDAYKLERIAMEISGGWQDQYAASVGGVNVMYFSRERHDVHNIRLANNLIYELEASLYLCFSGVLHDSSEIHKSIDLSRAERAKKMGETVKLAGEMLQALTDENLNDFDANINENWTIKKQYSPKISNDSLDKKIEFLRSAGASSAKILGAGGGGYILVRVPIVRNRSFVSRCLENEVFPERVLFDMEGVISW